MMVQPEDDIGTAPESEDGARPPKRPADAVARMLTDYRREAGRADELLRPDGSLRPVWSGFLERLAAMEPAEISGRFARSDRYLQDAGVFYRKYDAEGPALRDWPFAHIPVLIAAEDWRTIERGLIQRAELLERLAQDLYGPNRLVAEGHLPASLVARNPAWLRPAVAAQPSGTPLLHMLAFELGRGPDGAWWVLGDRAEAPSGAGFALENRGAAARSFPEAFAGGGIRRLSGFFRAFQNALEGGVDGHIAVLSPGPMNDAYFEHAFIARHLGLLLAEGEDLTLHKGRVMVRTVAGLEPVGTIWRRLDAVSCDPLELDPDSRIGTPGLLEALRAGKVRLVNAPGSGVLETRAFLSFLPRLAEVATGAPLDLPNIATWWCGSARERDHVLEQAEAMLVGSAFATRLPFDAGEATLLARLLRGRGPERLRELLVDEGAALVGQEAVTLSTTPAWEDGRLVPRPMILRVFLARTAAGWQAMPGGYARVGQGPETAAIAMQQGGKVGDVWVVDRPTPEARRLPPPKLTETRRRSPETLPARAADNLLWLGRYVERAEAQMRLFRAWHARHDEGLAPDAPLLMCLSALAGVDPVRARAADAADALASAFESPLEAALACAGRVRDRFSADGMAALRELAQTAQALSALPLTPGEAPTQISLLLRMITGFSGLVHENMTRTMGWRFLSLGLSLERAAGTAAALATLGHVDAPDGGHDLLLELGDSAMTHRARFSGPATAETVAALLALDTANPRAILYHLGRAKTQIDALPDLRSGAPGLAPVPRLALQLHTHLAVETPATLTPAKLDGLRRGLWHLSDLVREGYLR